LYAKAKRIGVATNTKVESMAILEALQYCMGKELMGVIVGNRFFEPKKND